MLKNIALAVLTIALLVLIWSAFHSWNFSGFGSAPVACTEEAKVCPDGSSVGRVGPKCEFAECPALPASYKDATYMIDGTPVTLKNGEASTAAAPGSASMIKTKYFGNELVTDLDGDGQPDVAFILTQNRGGSGTFYYAVAARNTGSGYRGSDGYFLGDRIAPQATNVSQNLRQKYVVVFNFADRPNGAPMTVAPSIGKSAYLKLVPETMQWAVVMPDFEGEAKKI